MARVLLVVALTALAASSAASAKSYALSRAAITYRIRPDGSVLATERLTFQFTGSFSGAYRLIPTKPPESIDHITVSDGDEPDEPGGSADVGSSSPPGTFGTAEAGSGDWTQVAWHYDASNETRTFTLGYRMQRFVVAHRDVGDLYLQVWGDQWRVPVQELQVMLILPRPVRKEERSLFRAWGHPARVKGRVSFLGANVVELRATSVPAHQFVELETTFPRRLLTTTAAARVRGGDGLAGIVARERGTFASPYGDSPDPAGISDSGFNWIWIPFGAVVLFGAVSAVRNRGRGRAGGGDSSSSGGGGDFGGGGDSGGGDGGGGGDAW